MHKIKFIVLLFLLSFSVGNNITFYKKQYVYPANKIFKTNCMYDNINMLQCCHRHDNYLTCTSLAGAIHFSFYKIILPTIQKNENIRG